MMERGGRAGAWKLERLRVEGDARKFGNQINSIEQGRAGVAALTFRRENGVTNAIAREG